MPVDQCSIPLPRKTAEDIPSLDQASIWNGTIHAQRATELFPVRLLLYILRTEYSVGRQVITYSVPVVAPRNAETLQPHMKLGSMHGVHEWLK